MSLKSPRQRVGYRPEIDGLRTIAVMAVVIYHAEILINGSQILAPGGYLGVDIFFVISGYLITRIILREIAEDRLSIIHFYERRIRRILPALFVVMFFSIFMGWFYMMPNEFSDFAGSGLSSLFFGSNFWFYLEDSYTADVSALKPLLHTWTLSLEEQFYILFPPFVYVVHKFAQRHLSSILFSMLLASLFLSQYMSSQSPEASFFLLHSRAWELLAGSMLAYIEINYGRNSMSKLVTSYIPLIGISLILYSIITFTDKTHHPGFFTLIPIISTCAVIWYCNGKDLLSVILKSRVFVGCGLISYSLYLWHFVIFAFARIRLGELSIVQSIYLMGASLLAAIVSYYLVEMPFRNRLKMSTKKVLIFSTGTFLVLGLLFGYIYFNNGVSSRLGPYANVIERSNMLGARSLGFKCSTELTLRKCISEIDKPVDQIVLVGDSHALSLLAELNSTARKNNLELVTFVAGGCPYLLDTYVKLNKNEHKNCRKERAIQLRESLSQIKPSTVIYAANMPYWLESKNFDNREGGIVATKNVYQICDINSNRPLRGKILKTRILKTIEDIQSMGHKVVLVYPIPEAGWDVPQEVARNLNSVPAHQRMTKFKSLELSISSRVARQRAIPTEEIYNVLGNRKELIRILPRRLLCDHSRNRCDLINDSDLLYSDETHVSPAGARIIVDDIARKLNLKL